MGAALELITGFVTAPGATLTAATMASGNSLTIRNTDPTKMIRLLTVWSDHQAAGTVRIRSPKMHDNVQGLRLRATVSDASPILPLGVGQRLYSQDTLIMEISGSGVATQIETACMLVYYEDLQGVAGRFITVDELMRRGVNQVSVENTLSLGTAGGYSGEEAINAEYDLLKANQDYALVGYTVDTECAAIGWRGADTGNIRVAGPGNETLRHVTCEWFMRLSRQFGIPLIPVFNSANRAGILIDGAQDQVGADPLLNSLLVELGPGGAPAR